MCDICGEIAEDDDVYVIDECGIGIRDQDLQLHHIIYPDLCCDVDEFSCFKKDPPDTFCIFRSKWRCKTNIRSNNNLITYKYFQIYSLKSTVNINIRNVIVGKRLYFILCF